MKVFTISAVLAICTSMVIAIPPDVNNNNIDPVGRQMLVDYGIIPAKGFNTNEANDEAATEDEEDEDEDEDDEKQEDAEYEEADMSEDEEEANEAYEQEAEAEEFDA